MKPIIVKLTSMPFDPTYAIDEDTIAIGRPRARVAYWLAPGRRVVLLTVFRKTKPQETAEVERAQRAQRECEASHGHAEVVFDREV